LMRTNAELSRALCAAAMRGSMNPSATMTARLEERSAFTSELSE